MPLGFLCGLADPCVVPGLEWLEGVPRLRPEQVFSCEQLHAHRCKEEEALISQALYIYEERMFVVFASLSLSLTLLFRISLPMLGCAMLIKMKDCY